MKLDLRRLSHLVALDDERHFARAAERVHLSQPAFSRSIQTIEDQVGQRLFDREGGEVKPTPAGVFMLERARRLLFDARNLQRDMDLYGGGQVGDCAFGYGTFLAASFMPDVVAELRRRYPGVRLRVEVMEYHHLYELLRAERIEFFAAVLSVVPDDAALEIRTLRREPFGVFVRPEHPLAGRACTLAEVWRSGHAAGRAPASLLPELAKLLALPAGEEPLPALQTANVPLMRRVALATDTALAISDSIVRADVDAGRLVRLAVTDAPSFVLTTNIVSLRGRTLSPVARHAVLLIEATAREA